MPLNSAKAEGFLSQQSVRRPTAKCARRTAISPGADLDEGVLCIPLFIAAKSVNNNRRKTPRRVEGRPQSPSSRPQARNPIPAIQSNKIYEEAAKGGGATAKPPPRARRREILLQQYQTGKINKGDCASDAAMQKSPAKTKSLGDWAPGLFVLASCTRHVTG